MDGLEPAHLEFGTGTFFFQYGHNPTAHCAVGGAGGGRGGGENATWHVLERREQRGGWVGEGLISGLWKDDVSCPSECMHRDSVCVCVCVCVCAPVLSIARRNNVITRQATHSCQELRKTHEIARHLVAKAVRSDKDGLFYRKTAVRSKITATRMQHSTAETTLTNRQIFLQQYSDKVWCTNGCNVQHRMSKAHWRGPDPVSSEHCTNVWTLHGIALHGLRW